MSKNRVRLTESQLHRVIKESVKRILREEQYNFKKEMDIQDAWNGKNARHKRAMDALGNPWNDENHNIKDGDDYRFGKYSEYWDDYDMADNERKGVVPTQYRHFNTDRNLDLNTDNNLKNYSHLYRNEFTR